MKQLLIPHAAMRGAIGAMAMTGMRNLWINAGLVDEDPPQAIIRQRAKGVLKRVPRRRRRVAVELAHWVYGAVGGALYALLPEQVRQRRGWSGPAYGVLAWLGFEAGLAPVLGLRQARTRRLVERLLFLVDHLIYGLVLSETRRRPSE